MKINGTSVTKASFGKDKELVHSLYVNDELKWSLFSGTENTTTCSIAAATGVTLPSNLQIPKSLSLSNINNKKPVTNIQTNGFKGRAEVTAISVPDSVTSIGDAAFEDCSNLTSITIPFVGRSSILGTYGNGAFGQIFGRSYSSSTGTKISQTFYMNNPISTVSIEYYIPSNLMHVTITGDGNIIYGAFSNCSMIKTITFTGKPTTINMFAFLNCSDLNYIVLPNSITSIGDNAFTGCSSLNKVYYEGTIEDWTKITIAANNSNLTNATRYYYSETHTQGNCWHWVEGVPTIWEHSWDDGYIIEEATCTSEGSKLYTCTTCKGTETESIPAAGHSYEDVYYEPTATEDGYIKYSCTNCDHYYTESTGEPATGYSVTVNNGSTIPNYSFPIAGNIPERIYSGESFTFTVKTSLSTGYTGRLPEVEVTGADSSIVPDLGDLGLTADDKLIVTVSTPRDDVVITLT